jgi:chemotaxis protein histidine kinase CheA
MAAAYEKLRSWRDEGNKRHVLYKLPQSSPKKPDFGPSTLPEVLTPLCEAPPSGDTKTTSDTIDPMTLGYTLPGKRVRCTGHGLVVNVLVVGLVLVVVWGLRQALLSQDAEQALQKSQEAAAGEKEELAKEQHLLMESERATESEKEMLTKEQQVRVSQERATKARTAFLQQEFQKSQKTARREKEELASEQHQLINSQKTTEQEKEDLTTELKIQASQKKATNSRIASLQQELQTAQKTAKGQKDELATEQYQLKQTQSATEQQKEELAKEQEFQASQAKAANARTAFLQTALEKSQETAAGVKEELAK